VARKNFQKPQQNTQTGTKNTLFFSEDPNVASRSACSAYPYEKINNRVAVVKDSPFRSKPLVVRFAEILLRFAETSQQTLRHFLLLPTTYINFAEKNALKSKLLRHLTHTTIVDSNFMARGFRAKVAAAACRWSPVEPLQSHSILSLARRVRFHFLAFGLQPSALSFDLHQPLDYRALSEIIGFEFPVAFVLPDGPETLAWRFMTGELLVEQAILDPLATREDIQRFCDEATRRGYHAISVPSSRVAETYEFLQDSDLNVSCLVGFPFGNADADVKRFETEVAVDNGAHEINLMISLGYIKERAFQRVLRELRDVVEAADERVVKVFIEPRFLTPPELEDTVNLVLDSGAQFIATTVWSSGSVLDEVRRLRELVGDKFGVLAATAQDNLDPKELLSLGATRLLIAKIGQTIRSSEQAFGI
jgi:deoxyribose-phosphate aldolase